eukprot:5355210-Pleurochrysis_carterae.AAC.1
MHAGSGTKPKRCVRDAAQIHTINAGAGAGAGGAGGGGRAGRERERSGCDGGRQHIVLNSTLWQSRTRTYFTIRPALPLPNRSPLSLLCPSSRELPD